MSDIQHQSGSNGDQAQSEDERRRYFRHPVDVPIQIFPQTIHPINHVPLLDVGEGGLAFRTNVVFEPGSHLIVRIDSVDPVFEAVGVVRWNAVRDGEHEVGVQFLDDETCFRLRMVEQVCQIERYRQSCLEDDGRDMDFEQAAREWIELYGADFGATDPVHDPLHDPTSARADPR
ncbi:MAG: PilZ domain-containing protein [Mariprofundaceae bacterium]